MRQNDRKKLWRTKRFLLAHWKCSTNDFERKLKFENFCPGEVRVRQNDIEKIMAYQKIFIGPLVWKCSTNNFERKLKFEHFAQVKSRVRQNDKQLWRGVPKNFYWPIGLKMFQNDFELLLSEN